MLLFGHAGITLAIGALFTDPLAKRLFSGREAGKISLTSQSSSHIVPEGVQPSSPKPTSLTLLKNRIDYRILLIGALLPDLIDKPIGNIFFSSVFHNGRIFSHTLCFILLLALPGIYTLKVWRKTWLLILAFGSAIHLLLDQMWLTPQTLLWPLYGWSFPRLDTTDFFQWLPQMFHTLMTDASVYIPELIGFIILACFTANLIKKKQVHAFIVEGIG